MIRVQQEDRMGCVIACAAMITGKSYQQVKSEIPCWTDAGMCGDDIYEYLADNGFAVALKYRVCNYKHPPSEKYNYDRDWREWPPKPFASIHLCYVTCYKGGPGHMIIMLNDGTILDPDTPETKSLTDYFSIGTVAGVAKLNESTTRMDA